MATPASLPPIQPTTGAMALNSLPSDFETYDLAPAGPLPSGKDLRLTGPGMHEERRQDAGMQAVRWESARSCWRVLVDGLTITDSRASWRVLREWLIVDGVTITDSRASWRVCCSWNA